VCVVARSGKRRKTRLEVPALWGSCHSYFTVSSLSVMRKMVSFRLIVSVCARSCHVNTISGISSWRAATG
jgi:hypothetical protein